MLRSAIVCGVLLMVAPVAVAQDMPLTMFLLDGESRKRTPCRYEPRSTGCP